MTTHWKKLTNPNYIGSWALEPGKDLTVKITKVSQQVIKGFDGKSEEKVVAELEGQKPLVLNNTNMDSIAIVLKTPYIEEWVGKNITLYVTKVSAFGEYVDALRVREMVIEPHKKMATVEQVEKIVEGIERANSDVKKILTAYKIEKLDELTYAQADTVIKKLAAKLTMVNSSVPTVNHE